MSDSLLKQAEQAITITASEVCRAAGGELLAGSAQARVGCVSTDTREDLKGCLFVALQGQRFDGSEFGEEALAMGAAGVLAEQPAAGKLAAALSTGRGNGSAGNGSHPIVIAVSDSGQALLDIAALVARKSLAKIVAVTGSTGKTSTKDMLHDLLKGQVSTVASRASFNNEVGVPLTLLSLKQETAVVVIEMGMKVPGEIGQLVKVAPPEIAIITNIGPAHLEYAGSLENIAYGKAEIAQELPPHGGLVVPYGEDLLAPHISDASCEIITFGFDDSADVHPVFHRHLEDGGLECRISCVGEEIEVNLNFEAHHHMLNFMAALGAYSLLGMPLEGIKSAAPDIQLLSLRGERIDLPSGVTLLNDCYNANPLSMVSSLDHLVSVALGRRTVAVLGDMAELGERAKSYHVEVGRKVAQLGIDCLVGVGDLAAGYLEGAGQDIPGQKQFYFADRSAALKEIPAVIQPGDVVLVKASRFMKLEEISDAITRSGKTESGESIPRGR